MGWREINMNRRRPQPNYAVAPATPGLDRATAVLRKAVAAAIGAATEQAGETRPAESGAFKAFAAGYLLGFARQAALKDGVDCEASDAMTDLLRELAAVDPTTWGIDMREFSFTPRRTSSKAPRAHLSAHLGNAQVPCDAGYLVGHLEALCGSRKLLALARDRLKRTGPEDAVAYLTDCDVAADPMQTRFPTLSLRFDAEEREVIIEAFRGGSPDL